MILLHHNSENTQQPNSPIISKNAYTISTSTFSYFFPDLTQNQINPKLQTPQPELIKNQLQFHHLQLLRITKTENPLRFTPIHELNKLKKLHYQLTHPILKNPTKIPHTTTQKTTKNTKKFEKKLNRNSNTEQTLNGF